MKKKYIIPGTPIPWKRAGLNGKKFYDAQANDKNNVALFMLQQHAKSPLFDGPLELVATFYIHIPEAKRKLVKENDWQIEKGDFDNYCKFLADTMKDIILTDDKRICRAIIEKRYSKKPRTEFTIRELTNET